MRRVEGVADAQRDVALDDRPDGARVQHLRTEVGQLAHLVEGERRDDVRLGR